MLDVRIRCRPVAARDNLDGAAEGFVAAVTNATFSAEGSHATICSASSTSARCNPTPVRPQQAAASAAASFTAGSP
jgi:hypothetical protein